MIDDDTNKQLLRINDELIQLCKWLNERRDIESLARLIPLVDDLTHILLEAGKNKLPAIKSRRVNLYAREIHFQSDSNTLFAGVIARQDFFIPSLMKLT
jgi:hypothetical protein